MEGTPPPLQTKVVAVGNQKGGVGKTSNTVHLAAALAETGRKCLVWDLDVNCGSTQHFGIPDNMAILGTYEVLMGSEQPEEVIVREGDLEEVELPTNLDLLPARRNLEFIDQALVGKLGRFSDLGSVLKKPLQSLRGKYDYIFLDTAPNLTTPTIAAYKSADYFLLSAMPETFAVQGLNNALKDIQSVREHGGNPKLTLIGVVLSNVDGRLTRLARELLNYVDETFAQTPPWMRKYEATISRTTIIPTAQKEGRTIFQTEPHHKVTEQFRALAREFEARMRKVESQATGMLTTQKLPEPGAMNGAPQTEESVEGVVNG
jgi:chromosome partitioning protein